MNSDENPLDELEPLDRVEYMAMTIIEELWDGKILRMDYTLNDGVTIKGYYVGNVLRIDIIKPVS